MGAGLAVADDDLGEVTAENPVIVRSILHQSLARPHACQRFHGPAGDFEIVALQAELLELQLSFEVGVLLHETLGQPETRLTPGGKQ